MNPNRVLVEETTFDLWVNGRLETVFACTPGAIRELVLGHLVSQGYIDGVDQVVFEDERSGTVRVRISGGSSREKSERIPLDLACSSLREFAGEMFSRAVIYKKGGGIHCAALTDGEKLVAFKEDIGRQNALDKVVGEALLKGLPLNRLGYISSGRINIEIMEKVKNCRFPLVVSRSLVSSLAYEEAKRHRIALIGRIGDPSPIMYNSPGIESESRDERKFA